MNIPPQIDLDIVYHPATDVAAGETHQSTDAAATPYAAPHPLANSDDSARFWAAARWIANHMQLGGLRVSISLVDDAAIQEVNREELGHDWATDVISFVFDTERKADGLHVDGEVIASYETAGRLCEAAGWAGEDELLLYVLHGMLHLAGLDDVDEQDRQRMREAEQACLRALGVAGAEEYLTRWERVSY